MATHDVKYNIDIQSRSAGLRQTAENLRSVSQAYRAVMQQAKQAVIGKTAAPTIEARMSSERIARQLQAKHDELAKKYQGQPNAAAEVAKGVQAEFIRLRNIEKGAVEAFINGFVDGKVAAKSFGDEVFRASLRTKILVAQVKSLPKAMLASAGAFKNKITYGIQSAINSIRSVPSKVGQAILRAPFEAPGAIKRAIRPTHGAEVVTEEAVAGAKGAAEAAAAQKPLWLAAAVAPVRAAASLVRYTRTAVRFARTNIVTRVSLKTTAIAWRTLRFSMAQTSTAFQKIATLAMRLGRSIVSGVLSPIRRLRGGLKGANEQLFTQSKSWRQQRADMMKTFVAWRPFQSAMQGVNIAMAASSGSARRLAMQLMFLGWGMPKVAIAVAAVASAFLSLAKTMQKAVQVESQVLQWSYLTGSMQKAVQAMQAAHTWAIRYGLSITDVNAAIVQLAQHHAISNSAMKAAADFAAATGTTVEAASRVITAAVGDSKENLDSLLQYGITVDKSSVNLQNRAAVHAAVIEAIERRYGGAADKNARTVAASFKRIAVSFKGSMREMAAPFISLLRPAMIGIANFAARLYKLAHAIWHTRQVSQFWHKTLAILSNTLTKYRGDIASVGDFIKGILVRAFWNLLYVARGVVYVFRFGVMVIHNLRNVFHWLGKELKPIADMFRMVAAEAKHLTFSGVLGYAKKFAMNLPSYIKKGWAWAKKQMTLGIQHMETIGKLFWDNVLSPIVTSIKDWGRAVYSEITKQWPAVKRAFLGLWQAITGGKKPGNIWKSIEDWLKKTPIGRRIAKWIEDSIPTAKKAVDKLAALLIRLAHTLTFIVRDIQKRGFKAAMNDAVVTPLKQAARRLARVGWDKVKEQWGKFSAWFAKTFPNMTLAIHYFVKDVKEAYNVWKKILGGHGDPKKTGWARTASAVLNILKVVAKNLRPVVDIIGSIIVNILAGIATLIGLVPRIAKVIYSLAKDTAGVYKAASKFGKDFLNGLIEATDHVLSLFGIHILSHGKKQMNEFWQELLHDPISTVLKGLVKVAEWTATAVHIVASIIEAILNAIDSVIVHLRKGIHIHFGVPFVHSIAGAVKDAFSVKSWKEHLADAPGNFIAYLKNRSSGWPGMGKQFVGLAFSDISDSLFSMFALAWPAIQKSWTQWWQAGRHNAKSWFKDSSAAVATLVTDTVNSVLKTMGSTWNTIRDSFARWWASAKDSVATKAKSIADTVVNTVEAVFKPDMWQGLLGTLKAWLNNNISRIRDVAAGVAKAAWGAITDMFDKLIPHMPTLPNLSQPNPEKKQAFGGAYLVHKPTVFLAGENGPEVATFTPVHTSRSNSLTINITVTGNQVIGDEGIDELSNRIADHISRQVSQRVGVAWAY